jgi:adenine deaminase
MIRMPAGPGPVPSGTRAWVKPGRAASASLRSTPGLDDRGWIAPGARADLGLVDDSARWPRVRLVLPVT